MEQDPYYSNQLTEVAACFRPRAIYAASFNPFSRGHLEIIEKASTLFNLTILLVRNSTTNTNFSPAILEQEREQTRAKIMEVLSSKEISAQVYLYNGLVADYAAENHIYFLVRGLHPQSNLSYEKELRDLNYLVNPSLTSIYLTTDFPFFGAAIRELKNHGKDISSLVP